MSKPVIGIMVWRNGRTLSEPAYFRGLVREGQKLGAVTYLFTLTDIEDRKKKINGLTLSPEGEWQEREFGWPDVVIDRYRRGGSLYTGIRNSSLFVYANNKFTNKWTATQLFLREDRLKRWMPETLEYNHYNLRRMLNRHSLLYIKPGNGTAGSSIVKLKVLSNGYEVLGRSRNLTRRKAVLPSSSSLRNWLDQWTVKERIHNGNFMVQQGLDLELVPGRVVDTRLLIQKNEKGVWEVTGLGMRVGAPRSSTSNLHGGGKALPFHVLLHKRFGKTRTESIRQECEELAQEVVRTIERHFGSMMEFGLDIGIDVDGKVWLIEVNPKPGREIFREMGDKTLYRKAVRRPLEYAVHLAQALAKTSAALDEEALEPKSAGEPDEDAEVES
ncbi:YheC/YheD family protein [Paenibacillus aurantius]|uniref:YheC/YheD family protein n=1 Tax=Paenibacillus aurantius TaxID=2918900 RepID=A0AA96LB64_9BACL|nr:YheC/YheD family protein [Paenibacillus aurantius]WNQ09953.1 YheC/YheD family protein [Paenibacillus aurantius]